MLGSGARPGPSLTAVSALNWLLQFLRVRSQRMLTSTPAIEL
jgi:hypothetical protein